MNPGYHCLCRRYRLDYMTKQESVQAGLSSIEAALSKVFDDGVASVGSGGGFSQADIDAAVLAAKAADAVVLAEAVAAVQVQLDAVLAEDVVEDAQMASLQAKLDAIKALLS